MMGRPDPDLLVVFKEIQRKDKPIIDLRSPPDFALFLRILSLLDRYHLKLDIEQLSVVLIQRSMLEFLIKNPPRTENERLLRDYFSNPAYDTGFEVRD